MQRGKKGAVELSITTIVVVVIGITILTLGLKWVTNTMSGISEQTDDLQRVTEGQIMEIFGNSDKSISTVSKKYTVEQGKTLDNLEVYLRNNLHPGATYSLQYTLNILSNPASINGADVLANVNWVKSPIEMTSGESYSDTVLINTQNLPLGVYKFEAVLSCSPSCSPIDPKHQFIVTIV